MVSPKKSPKPAVVPAAKFSSAISTVVSTTRLLITRRSKLAPNCHTTAAITDSTPEKARTATSSRSLACGSASVTRQIAAMLHCTTASEVALS